MSAKDIFTIALSLIPKLLKLGIECKKEVGEFNLTEDLPTIIDYVGKAVKEVIDSLKED